MKEQYMRIKQAKIQHYALAVSVHTKKPRKVCLRGCAAGGGAAGSVMEQADGGISAKYYTLIYYFLKKG